MNKRRNRKYRCKKCGYRQTAQYDIQCYVCGGEVERVFFVANTGEALYKNFAGDMFRVHDYTKLVQII